MSDFYDVKIPVSGVVHFTGIEADSEEEAIALALEKNITDGEIEDLTMYENICDGCEEGCNGDVSNVEYPDAEAVGLNDED